MSFLKRDQAPILASAWKEIDEAASRTLTTHLKGRRIVDVSAPLGWEASSVGVGRLDIIEDKGFDLEYGVRRVQPLVEMRARFELEVWELDNAARGAMDIDLDAVEKACRAAANFEDSAIFSGLESEAARIRGLRGDLFHDAVDFELDPNDLLNAVSQAILSLQHSGIEGPYALVLDGETFRFAASASGYPLMKRLRSLLDGPVVESEQAQGAILASLRGGDFVLTLGHDFAIGFEHHEPPKVQLFLTESFTFQVLEPKALVALNRKA